MSIPTSTSAAGAGRGFGSEGELEPGRQGSAPSAETAEDDGWLTTTSGGVKRRPAVIIILLVVAGLLTGGAISQLVSDNPPRGPGAPAPSAQPDTAPRQDDVASGGTPPQRPPAQEETAQPPKWRPVREEVYPNAKVLASRVVERLTAFGSGVAADQLAADTARRFDVEASKLLDAAQELVRPGLASTGVVVYPQLAGVRPDKASVMVVVDQTLDDGSRTWVERRTVDVRLRLRGTEWGLDRVGSAGGTAIERPTTLSQSALAVVDNPRIQLSDSARWDIYSGTVNEGLLEMMVRVAERHEIAVVTIATGHPVNVFATDIMSNHTRGRAVDIFSVDGEQVVASREKGSPTFRLARWLYKQGVPELGSPWAFDGYGGRSFTDVVHEDHIHFAM